jgi:hypothetical protein
MKNVTVTFGDGVVDDLSKMGIDAEAEVRRAIGRQRIKELVEQATSITEVKHEGYRGKGYTTQEEFFDKEKFAELIVTDCINLLMDHHLWRSEISDIFEKHFGVEE